MGALVGFLCFALILVTAECQNVASAGFGLITDGGSYTSYTLTLSSGKETISLWSPNNGACSSEYTARYDDDSSSSITVNDDCTFTLQAWDIAKKGTKRKILVTGANSNPTFTFEVKFSIAAPVCIMVTGAVLMLVVIALAIAVRCYRHNVQRKGVLVLMLVYALCAGFSLALLSTGLGLYSHIGFVKGLGISGIIQVCIQIIVDVWLNYYYKKRANKCGDNNRCGGPSSCDRESGAPSTTTNSEKIPPPPTYNTVY